MEITVYKVRDHDSRRYHDLEHPSDAPTHLLRRAFGHIGGCDSAYRADTEARHGATTIDVPEATIPFATCYGLQYLPYLESV
jgi:hypothetical protein